MRKLLLIGGAATAAVLTGAVAFAGWLCYPTLDAAPVGAQSFALSQSRHAAHGFGSESARVDSQITLRIPPGRADAVYEYLRGKYVGQDHVLKSEFPELHLHGQTMSDTSVFTDEYFDTPRLDLYRNRNSARHRTRINTTHPTDRKSGRSLVQMKVTPRGEFNLRSELKYEVKVRNKPPKTVDDLHPLVRLIAKDQRDDFKQVYRDAGIDPLSLRHVFTITQTRRRGYLNWDSTNIFSFSVDEGSARVMWAKGSFASVDLGLVEIAYTEADPVRRQKLWDIRDAIIRDLKQRFPELCENSDSKYGIVLEQLMRQIKLIPALFRFGFL